MGFFSLHQKGLDTWRNDYEKIKDEPPAIFSIFLLARALGFKVALEKDIREKLKKEENEAISNIMNLNNLEYINQLLKKGEKSLDITDLFKTRSFFEFGKDTNSPDKSVKKMIVKKLLEFIKSELIKSESILPDDCQRYVLRKVTKFVDFADVLSKETAEYINEKIFTLLVPVTEIDDCRTILATGFVFGILHHPRVIERGSEFVLNVIKNQRVQNIDDTEEFKSLESFIRHEFDSNFINCELAGNPGLAIQSIIRFWSNLKSYKISEYFCTELSKIFAEKILLPDGLSNDLCEIIEHYGSADKEMSVEI